MFVQVSPERNVPKASGVSPPCGLLSCVETPPYTLGPRARSDATSFQRPVAFPTPQRGESGCSPSDRRSQYYAHLLLGTWLQIASLRSTATPGVRSHYRYPHTHQVRGDFGIKSAHRRSPVSCHPKEHEPLWQFWVPWLYNGGGDRSLVRIQ